MSGKSRDITGVTGKEDEDVGEEKKMVNNRKMKTKEMGKEMQ